MLDFVSSGVPAALSGAISSRLLEWQRFCRLLQVLVVIVNYCLSGCLLSS